MDNQTSALIAPPALAGFPLGRGDFQGKFHLPYNRGLVNRARELRKDMTKAERKLWYDFLRSYPLRFLRQRPISYYIVDFYCSKAQLVIEVDGAVHFSASAQEYDARRTRHSGNLWLKGGAIY